MTQLLARDLDNDPLVFGVVGEEASRFFAVESVTGVVWLRQPLDREVKLGKKSHLCSLKWWLSILWDSWGGCFSLLGLGIWVCPHSLNTFVTVLWGRG